MPLQCSLLLLSRALHPSATPNNRSSPRLLIIPSDSWLILLARPYRLFTKVLEHINFNCCIPATTIWHRLWETSKKSNSMVRKMRSIHTGESLQPKETLEELEVTLRILLDNISILKHLHILAFWSSNTHTLVFWYSGVLTSSCTNYESRLHPNHMNKRLYISGSWM